MLRKPLVASRHAQSVLQRTHALIIHHSRAARSRSLATRPGPGPGPSKGPSLPPKRAPRWNPPSPKPSQRPYSHHHHHPATPPQARTLSNRLKDLSRKYGWAAVGVYFGLSILDFPLCFMAVRLVGAERIGEWERRLVSRFWDVVGAVVPSVQRRGESTADGDGAREEVGKSVERNVDEAKRHDAETASKCPKHH